MFQETQTKSVPNCTIGIKAHRFTGEDNFSRYVADDCFSLILLSKGKFCAVINQQKAVLYSPTIICLSHIDVLENVELDKNAEILMVNFDPVVLNQNLNMESIADYAHSDLCDHHHRFQLQPFLEKKLKQKCFIINKASAQTYGKRIRKLEKTLEEQTDLYWFFSARSDLMILLYFIENILFRYFEKSTDDMIPKEFTNVVEFINANISKHITLEDLYGKFYINKTKLEILFRKYYNMSFKQYIQHCRLELAKDSLRFTNLTNQEIAHSIGFSSSQNFCKFFKSMTAISPEAFRKEQAMAICEEPKTKK